MEQSYQLFLGVRKYVRLEVGRLCKLLGAAVEWTDVRPVASVNADMRPEIEVERKPLTASLKCTLHHYINSKLPIVARHIRVNYLNKLFLQFMWVPVP